MSTIEPIHSGLQLRVLEGATQQELHRLERAIISVGRSTPETASTPNYITFPEPTLSRLHAVLTWEEGAKAYLLHHRSQTNPTIVNQAIIKAPQLLKPGDRITLGRLTLLIEPEGQATTTPSRPGTVEVASPIGICLNALHHTNNRTFSAPFRDSTLTLRFLSERASTAANREPGISQEVQLPAEAPSLLHFSMDSSMECCQVEAEPYNPGPTLRTTAGHGGQRLVVPLRTGYQLPFYVGDELTHQSYTLWLGDPEHPPLKETIKVPTIDPEKPAQPERFMSLKFLNGPWKNGELSIPSNGLVTWRLGPGSPCLGRHCYPFTDGPTCEISIHQGMARLLASSVGEDETCEVDGQPLLTGESTNLVGGSTLRLGATNLLWSDGQEGAYQGYDLREGEKTYPIKKAVVRLGTADYCEVILEHKELPPLLGTLTFTPTELVYHHHDLSSPIRIDGQEVGPGLTAKLLAGSQLELRPKILLTLEREALDHV